MPASSALAALGTVACLAACGCAAWSGPAEPPLLAAPAPARLAHRATPGARPAIIPASHSDAPNAPPAPVAEPRPLEGRSTLTAEDLVRVVLERNPTLDQMRAAAAAAAARYPQVTSLDDPTLAFSTAPGSAWSPNADYAARVEVAQKFLYPGKRGLKGAARSEERRVGKESRRRR